MGKRPPPPKATPDAPPRKKRDPAYITIPRGTKPVACSRCRAPMYWAPHPNTGNAHPTSVAPEIGPECREPSAMRDGIGISHYANCPNANEFRKPKVPA